jgi:uncharacterized membrane protein YoaK (UPF0700 family)
MELWSEMPEYMHEQRRKRERARRRKTIMVLVSSFCVGFIVGVLLHYV